MALIGKTYNDLMIELDDEYRDMDFYKDKRSSYNYIKRKYEENYMKYGGYVSLYRGDYDEKLGYFYLSCYLSLNSIYKYPSYTKYIELLEFGFVNDNLEEIKFLIDYMKEYAFDYGALFIKVRTKEKSFNKFYNLLREYKHSEDDKYIYLDIEPNLNETNTNLVRYKEDKISLKDLYHLYAMGFKIYKDFCSYELYDKSVITVDRKTKEITYPKRIINIPSKYHKLNSNSFNLMHLVIFDNYSYANKTIDVSYKINGFDYELIKIDRELLTFENIVIDDNYNVKDEFYKFAEIAHKEHNCNVLYECGPSTFEFKKCSSSFSKKWYYLPNYLEK